MNRKFVSAALTVTTLVWGLGMAVLPVAANAQTTASLQAQIAALLAQIQQLQGQLGTSGSSSTGSMSYSFTKDLTLGSTGADVTALQQLLISKGELTAVSAPTGYFGSLTQAALAAFQAANGISPAAGYFGPKTRAFVNSMSVSTTTTTTTTTTTGNTTTGTTVTTNTSVTAPATGMAVSLALDNPTNGSLISSSGSGGGSAARVPVLSVNFTAGNSGPVTLTGVQFNKTGVLADSSISGAYLTQNGQVVAQYNSINQGVISFNGMSLQVPAGQTVELTLAIDVASGLSAGNTTGFALTSASNVSAFDMNNNAVTVTGPLPLVGSTLTVTTVTNPSLATLAITSSSIGTTVTAGTQGNIVGAWSFTGGNNKVWLKSLNFHVIGSANKGDIRNVKLMVNGVQVGQTLAAVPATGLAYFNAMSNPGVLNTGSNNVQLVADVMGSPSYNFQFEILNSYDVLAVDSQYNVPIGITNSGGIGTLVAIQTGTITVSQDSNTPTGNIAVGQSSVPLAKFDIYAGGEAVKVEYIGFSLAFTGVSTASNTSLSAMVKNISLTDDAGSQVGTTINTPPSGSSCDVTTNQSGYTSTGAGSSALTSASVTYVDCFGTSGSNINYIVAANTTRVLTLKADIQSGANFTNVLASLIGENNNLQGLISSQPGSSSGASGASLSLQSTLLTAAQNNAVGTQVLTPNSSAQTVGSYALTASSASGVSINTVSIQAIPNNTANFMQNLRLMINGTQFGTTQPVVASKGVYSFSGSPFTVPAGQTVNVNVVADTLSTGASTSGGATVLTSCSGTGLVSNNSVTCTSVTGQNVTFNTTGTTLAVLTDANTQLSTQYVMPSSQVALATFDFSETQNIEPVKITGFTVQANAGASILPGYANLQIYNGSGQSLGAGSAAAVGTKNSTTGSAATPASTTITVTAPNGATATSSPSIVYLTVGSLQPLAINVATTTGSSTLISTVVSAVNANPYLLVQATAASGTILLAASGTLANSVTAGNGTTVSIFSSNASTTFAAVSNMSGGASSTLQTTSTSTGVYAYTFNFATPIIVPQGYSTALTLKGDLPSFTAGAVTDNSTSSFSIATSTIIALGANSSKAPTITGSATGNVMTVLRSTLTPSLVAYGTTRAARSTQDEIATLTFTPNANGQATLATTTLTFSGSVVSSTAGASTSFLNNVTLWLGNSELTTAQVTSSTAQSTTASGTYTKTWNFAVTSSGTQIGAATTYQIYINDYTGTTAGSNGTSLGLNVSIQNTTDVMYYDSSVSDSTAKAVSLPSNFGTPTIQVSFGQGV